RRVNAREELVEAQLALGRHGEVVSELEAFVREHPFRERARGQLMLALYRSGRQAQALEAFQQARRTLVDELGVEPGDALRDLEQAILNQDPALLLAAPGSVSNDGPTEPTAAQPVVEGSADVAPRPAVVRKTATVLVATLSVDGEVDPETARSAVGMAREHADELVLQHGGRLVVALGGEVTWVFGVPLVREDDALRALRAADELRSVVLGGPLLDVPPVTVRLGVASGEVIAESAHDLFGDPVTAAGALAHAALPGGVLIGDETRRLTDTAIRVEPALDATAWQVLELDRQPVSLGSLGPMVGRDAELESALAAFADVHRRGEAKLLTVLGEAGIGKSRLVRELRRRLEGDANVIVGRCLSYGQGSTFWPLREALVQAAGEESRAAVHRLLDGADDADVVTDILAAALDLGPAESVGEQLPWAVRRLLEVLAAKRPLLLFIDDVHWADDRLLDLVDYLIDWLRAPVLLVCSARPELLELRPTWGGGHAHVSSVVLGPLDDAAALRHLEQQLGHRPLSEAQRSQILSTAEGNPLFVEQLLQMSAENPAWDRDAQIPGTIQALLSARLDRLGPGERALIECAAIIGREFWPSAVRELLPVEAQPSAEQHLRALVHRGLIRPDRSVLAGEEQLRFHHILIRDVAYRSTPKVTRSALHERFAKWLIPRGEVYDEFVGYHLEQAFQYRAELGSLDRTAVSLAGLAGDRLTAAGRRALARGDAHASVRLLRSGQAMLMAAGRKEPGVLLTLGSALGECGDLQEAGQVLTAAYDQSREMGEANLAARASIDLSFNQIVIDPSVPLAEMLRVADEAVRTFERSGDHGGIARAWHHVAMVHWIQSRAGDMEEALERAMTYAERADDRQMQSRINGYLARVSMTGPMPVTEGIDRCSAILEHAGDDVVLTAVAETMLGMLEAMRGDFALARSYADAARRRLPAVGLTVTVAVLQMYSGWIELMAASPERALPGVQDAYDLLDRVGEGQRRAMTAALLSRLYFFCGDYDHCRSYLTISEESASPDDAGAQALSRGTRARLLAATGELPEARELADSAVEALVATEYLSLQADVLVDRATVLTALGQNDAASGDLHAARTLFERKGITSSLEAMQRAFEALTPAR
ncbi:MAG TPA: BTAD domain-containing putative transcriptional regulator, partial [Solirubrobacteraceae bacterium]